MSFVPDIIMCAPAVGGVGQAGREVTYATPYPENISLLTCTMQEWITSAETLITAILWRKLFLLPNRILNVFYTPIVAQTNCRLSRPRFLLSWVLPVCLPTHLLSCCGTWCSPEFDDDRLNRLLVVPCALWPYFAAPAVAFVAAAVHIILLSFFVAVIYCVCNDISPLSVLCYSALPLWRHRSYVEAKDCNKESTRCRLRLKCDCTHAETRFRLSAKRMSPFKSAGASVKSTTGSRGVASAIVMLDTPCSEVMWRVMATHSIRQFPLHFPSRASPCSITFQLDSNRKLLLLPCTGTQHVEDLSWAYCQTGIVFGISTVYVHIVTLPFRLRNSCARSRSCRYSCVVFSQEYTCCYVTAQRSRTPWQRGRDTWSRDVSKVGYGLALRDCSVRCWLTGSRIGVTLRLRHEPVWTCTVWRTLLCVPLPPIHAKSGA